MSTLGNNKAPDALEITSEYLKLASEHPVPILTDIINRIMRERKLPSALKAGIAMPIPKKSVSQTDLDKFRPITITSLIGKLVEKHMVYLSNLPLDEVQSCLQFGFTKNVPCSTASMLLMETVSHYKDMKA